MAKKTLFLDTETASATELYNNEPREHFRLGQFAWGRDGEVVLTEDFDELLAVMDEAELIVAHNGFYDLRTMYGKHSMKPLQLAIEGRVLDTFNWYPLEFAVPKFYATRDGKNATTYREGKQKPELVKRFLALDNLTHYHNLPGKVGSLRELAKKYNPPKTKIADLRYELIPIDDPEFREYAAGDIVALQGLASYILSRAGGVSAYAWREMLVTAINDQITANGFKVDVEEAEARVKELQDNKDRIMAWLVEEFDFPTTGKSPWMSAEGKGSILKAFDTFGIRPEGNPDWDRSEKTNAPSFSKEVLQKVSAGTEAEELAEAIGTLAGQRSLAELALDSTYNDGLCHPEITALQRSGRFSVTKPSLPIWGSRTEELAEEKRYFVARPGRHLYECDFSNADQRIVAAMSGDEEYAKRFEPGVDGHEVSGRLMFGDEEYDLDPKGKRHISKALSHAYAYGAGAKTLARTSKLPESDDPEQTPLKLAYRFIDAMNTAYPWNKSWREWAYKEGLTGLIVNSFGRKLFVDEDRAYTMAPGLLGQAGTRDVLTSGLIRIATGKHPEAIRWVVAHVHDAVIFDVPDEHAEWAIPYFKECLEMHYDPGTNISQSVFFPVSFGPAARTWRDCAHG